ncbi:MULTISPECIES: hypothetical protein [unclassified Paenibacillus]|uniref:hypothetical protein n=1 Tax=unclassified Paenibacillus TaxID=185978 RepID=UPI002781E34F|nr:MULTISPECIES: hypothetical protein [unclassified Paenibacillus]MDQ0896402.1 uncharacterized protein YcgL (UPF0745 family) [Paenibacillus sp. V4I7]MDQ0914054.1 uncharacterized protein YcgL (UPF0745 family) [Paenibacillus sp. V4I5]
METLVKPTLMQTRITIDEEGIQKPIVERIMGGVVVQEVRVNAVDLQKHMIHSADTWMLYTAILDDPKAFISELFRYEAEVGASGDRDDILNAIIEELSDGYRKSDDELMRKLLAVLLENANIPKVDNAAYNNLVKAMTEKLSKIEDPNDLRRMFELLLDKAHVFDTPDRETIKTILDATVRHVKEFESEDAINDLWAHLAKRVKKDVVLEFAKEHLDDLELTTPILPRNCLYFKQSKKRTVIALEVERARWDVNLRGQMIEQVGHPKLIFIFELSDRRINAKVAAVKDEVVTEKSKLYRYPFSHVSGNMVCCWNYFPALKEFRNIESYPYIFLQGERNFDLYVGEKNYRELLAELAGQDFDDKHLVETDKVLADIL